MAKYDVKFSCGHTETKELFGKGTERERKIEYWEQNGICTECYKKQQAELMAAKTQEMSLPTLEGSEKQIAWAEKIRVQMIERLESQKHNSGYDFERVIKEIGLDATKSQIEEKLSNNPARKEIMLRSLEEYLQNVKLLEIFKITTSAKWIIDHR
jgi:hypothetical protein